MGRKQTIIVVDDNESELTKSNILVEGTFLEVVSLSSNRFLSDIEIQKHASLISISTDTVDEENLIKILKGANGGSPLVLFKETPSLKKLGNWVLQQENGEISGEDKAVVEKLMDESLEYYQLSAVYQQCLKMITSYDMEKLLYRVTDACIHELNVESCVLWLSDTRDPDDFILSAVRGLINIDVEGSRFYLSKMDFFERVYSLSPFQHREPGTDDTFLYIPLIHAELPIGLMKLGRKLSREPFTEKEQMIGRIIGEYCAFAIKNLEKIQKLEMISLHDPETQVYSPSFFADFFEKESSKSIRFQRPLSLVYIHLDNYGYLTTKVKETIVHDRLSHILRTMAVTLRDSDIISKLASNRFCILLPETDYLGSMITIKRIRKAIRDLVRFDYLDKTYHLEILLRAVSPPFDGETLEDLNKSVDKKFILLKKSPAYRFKFQEKDFWDVFEILMSDFTGYRKGEVDSYGPAGKKVKSDHGKNRYFSMPDGEFSKVVEVISQDLFVDKEERGILLLAGPRPELIRQILSSFNLSEVDSKKVYILGKETAAKYEAENVLIVPTADERLDSSCILVYLKDSGAYALLISIGEGTLIGFNTSDEFLVETLYEKIQDMYSLQGIF